MRSALRPAGFLSPASRGSLLTALLVMYLLLAVAAGYTSVWLWGAINRSYEGWFKVRRGQAACRGGAHTRFMPYARSTGQLGSSCGFAHVAGTLPRCTLQVCWRVACFFPGITGLVITLLNTGLWATGSSGAIPLGFFFSVVFLWWARAAGHGVACWHGGSWALRAHLSLDAAGCLCTAHHRTSACPLHCQREPGGLGLPDH